MKNYKNDILNLKNLGLSDSEIAKKLNCSTFTVKYNLDQDFREKFKNEKKIRLLKQKNISETPSHKFKEKDILVNECDVDWRYAEMICQTKMVHLGYQVFIPSNGGGEIDFVAYKNSNFIRIQVKSFSPTKNCEKMCISLCRSSVNYKKVVYKKYTDIDVFMIYDGTNIYVVPKSKLENNNITLRYKSPKSMIVKGINMAKDYLIDEKSFY